MAAGRGRALLLGISSITAAPSLLVLTTCLSPTDEHSQSLLTIVIFCHELDFSYSDITNVGASVAFIHSDMVSGNQPDTALNVQCA